MITALKNITFAIWILFSTTAFAQVKFEKVYGSTGYDKGYSVAQMYDIGYAVVGTTTSFGSGSTDVYLLKTDSMGIAVGQKTFGGINIDQAYSIESTSDSGLVIAGYTNSFGAGGYDMYVIKTDKNCNTVWEKTYGGTNWDFAYSVQQTYDGGYIIAGGTYSSGNGSEDMYLVKTNSDGDTLWTKTYGGINDDEIKSIKQTVDSGFIFTGYTKSMGDVSGDIYAIRTDRNGNTIWTYKYSGGSEDYSYDVLEDSSGPFPFYYIAGETKISPTNLEGIVLTVGPTGFLVTTKLYVGAAHDGVNSIAQTVDGRFATVGYTYSFGAGMSDLVMYREKPIGTYAGSTSFGGGNIDKGYCIKNTKDGGYIMCGTSLSFSALDRIFLIKTDSMGVATGGVINTTTGINSLSKASGSKFTVYPNPANDAITIVTGLDASSDTDLIVIVTDLLGREKLSLPILMNASSSPILLNTQGLETGVYFINLSGENYFSAQKLIIQK
ncbi:MAG: T9SS type A sorting domain-containing protein [Bacteroidetes bacterium]|nr:T9SS type A sorting domain-containing protein [Bacteroidota bacterium]